jgi:hypothetical protein
LQKPLPRGRINALMEMETQTLTRRFTDYFSRDIAHKATKSIGDGSEIEFRVQGDDGANIETFTFIRSSGRNDIKPGAATDPQLIFTLSPKAAETILSDTTEDVGAIGVNILKLIVSPDNEKRVGIQLKAGFLTLFTKGYFGVLATGGTALASFLGSRGLDGMGAIKTAIKKLKG